MSDKIWARMTVEHFELKEGTKTVFVKSRDTETKDITEQQYKNIVEAAPFFRRLGGSETITKCYTVRGYTPFKIVSKNPDRTVKTVRTFDFDSVINA